ncbi:MAG: KaiC domain-containing protein [Candidatus Micrarchaeota archaeon]|nr:MAG: KaiC domain-containing protein [Candidatus Micrarchaeota archaeon]
MISTGIEGLDRLLGGGIPENNQVLLSGGPGAGKTLLAFNIAYNLSKKGINSGFICLDEESSMLLRNVKATFTNIKDIDDLINSKKLAVIKSDIYSKAIQNTEHIYKINDIIGELTSIISSNRDIRFLVIDSLTTLRFIFAEDREFRKALVTILSFIRRNNIIGLFTSEMYTSERKDLRFNEEFFIFDDILTMYLNTESNRRMPLIEVIKSRGTRHQWVAVPYEITPFGVNVIAEQED